MGEAAAGHDAAQAGDSTAYGQWELRQLEAFAVAVGMDDAAEGLAVATYLQQVSHANILLRWVSKRPDDQRALGLLREIGT
jgi:hypothetical protein